MKDAKGHGSNSRGGLSPTEQRMSAYGRNVIGAVARLASQHGIPTGHLGKQITILHQDGEYAVPNSGSGKTHYFTGDKTDAESTARSIHGKNITIKHRSKRWGPEMG